MFLFTSPPTLPPFHFISTLSLCIHLFELAKTHTQTPGSIANKKSVHWFSSVRVVLCSCSVCEHWSLFRHTHSCQNAFFLFSFSLSVFYTTENFHFDNLTHLKPFASFLPHFSPHSPQLPVVKMGFSELCLCKKRLTIIFVSLFIFDMCVWAFVYTIGVALRCKFGFRFNSIIAKNFQNIVANYWLDFRLLSSISSCDWARWGGGCIVWLRNYYDNHFT